MTLKQSNKVLSPIRIIGFIIALVILATLLINLPNIWRQFLFGVVSLISLGYGVYMSRQSIGDEQHTKQRILGQIVGIGGIISIIIATALFHPSQDLVTISQGFPFLFLGVMACLYSYWILIPSDMTPLSAQMTEYAIHWWKVVLGVICILAVAQIQIIPILQLPEILNIHVQVGLQILGLGLIIWGISGARLRLSTGRVDWLIVAIVGFAFVLRIFNLEYAILGFIDEGHFSSAVVRMQNDNQQLWLPFSGMIAFSWFFAYLQYIATELLQPSLLALRIPSAFLGTIQVWGMMALVAMTLNRRAGIFVGLALATFPPHIHYSRLGLNNIADPTFAVLTFYFLLRGLRDGHQRDFIISGVMLGMTSFFYEGGRIFYVPFALAFWVWYGIINGRKLTPTKLKVVLRQFAIWAFGALILILPFYYAWWANILPFFPRFEIIGGSSSFLANLNLLFVQDAAYVNNSLFKYFLHWVHFPMHEVYYGNHPLILWVMLPFFLIGLTYSLWQSRTDWGGLLFWWVMGVFVTVAILGKRPISTHYVIGFPAMGAIIGIGGYAITVWIPQIINHPSLKRVLSSLFVCLCFVQGAYYFVHFLPTYYETHFSDVVGESGFPTYDLDETFFRVLQYPDIQDVFVISQDYTDTSNLDAMRSYFGRVESLRFTLITKPIEVTMLTSHDLDQMKTRVPFALFLEPNDTGTLDMLRRLFPTISDPIFSPFPIPDDNQFVMYLVSSSDE